MQLRPLRGAEQRIARRAERNRVAAAVAGIRTAAQKAAPLQLVDYGDQVPRTDAGCIRQGSLRSRLDLPRIMRTPYWASVMSCSSSACTKRRRDSEPTRANR